MEGGFDRFESALFLATHALPWFSMFTMVIFLPAAALVGFVGILLIIRDLVVLGKSQSGNSES